MENTLVKEQLKKIFASYIHESTIFCQKSLISEGDSVIKEKTEISYNREEQEFLLYLIDCFHDFLFYIDLDSFDIFCLKRLSFKINILKILRSETEKTTSQSIKFWSSFFQTIQNEISEIENFINEEQIEKTATWEDKVREWEEKNKKELPPINYSQYCGELLGRLEYDENTKEYTKD